MPLYEFDCIDCGKSSELLVRSSNWKGVATCPNCASKKLEKRLSVFSSSTSSGSSRPAAESCATRPSGSCCGGGPHCH